MGVDFVKTIVSLVSDQTLQNVIFIEQMKKNAVKIDKYIFLTTLEMEKKEKTRHICKACGIEESLCKKIIAEEDKIEEIYRELEEKLREIESSFLVNITGGTKTMAIAVYDYFKRGFSGDNYLYYLPMGKNEYRLISPLGGEHIIIDWELDLFTYIYAHGLIVENEKKVKEVPSKEKCAVEFFRKYIGDNFCTSIIKRIKEKGRKKNKFIKLNLEEKFENREERKKVKEFINELGINLENEGYLSKYDVEYISAGWFEELVYYKIKKLLDLRDDQIWLGAQIVGTKKEKNEFDVMFIYKTRLNIVECKTDLGEEEAKIISDSLYKLQALKKKFGLRCKTFLCYTSSLRDSETEEIKKKYADRADSMDVKLMDRVILEDDKELVKTIGKN